MQLSEIAQYVDQRKHDSDNFIRLVEVQKVISGLKQVTY